MDHVWQMDSLLIFFPNYRELIVFFFKAHSRQIHENVAQNPKPFIHVLLVLLPLNLGVQINHLEEVIKKIQNLI